MIDTIIMILGVILGFIVLRMCAKAIPTNEEQFFKNHGITLEEYKKSLTNKNSYDTTVSKENKEDKESYSIVFCDTNNADTAFGTYGTYDTYETADHIIRMAWNKTRSQKVNDGYKVCDGWIVIKKN